MSVTISKELIILLRSGNENAFRQLVDQFQQKVLNTALGLVQDQGAAEDLAQEVFISVYKSIHHFNENASLSTWIYKITVNKCLDYLRMKKNRQKAGFAGFLFYNKAGESSLEAPDFIHPGVLAEKREQAQLLFKAIRLLPENQKTAFVLAHVEELPQKEIAAIMELSLKAVESLLQRAKGNLRNQLSDIYDRRKKQGESSKD